MRFVGRGVLWAICLCLLTTFTLSGIAEAKTAQEIDASVNAALDRFYKQVRGGRELVGRSQGVLVFAGVIKAGIGIGGEYGEGALRMGGRTNGYYSLAAASIGLQLGAQRKDIILVFLQRDALDKFRASDGWKVGVDGSVTIIDVGAAGSIDSATANKPIVGFVVGQKGLMYNLTLEGTKISKLAK
jgi:lipid-binding SYLF domain-containing protein